MAPLKVGDSFPAGVKFDWAPIEDSSPTACGRPQPYDASAEFADKKVVLVSVPGAFTPSCQAKHLPPYISNIDSLAAKGVDLVVVIAYNDAFVMNAWGKVNGLDGNSKVLLMSDTKTFFAKEHAWSLGERNARWAMVIDHGKVTYAEAEPGPGSVTVSGAEEVLSKL